MSRRNVRATVGLVAVLLVTAALTGAVATTAAVSHELSDGDHCETGSSDADVPETVTPENVTSLAGNVTSCIAEDTAGTDPPDGVAPPTGDG